MVFDRNRPKSAKAWTSWNMVDTHVTKVNFVMISLHFMKFYDFLMKKWFLTANGLNRLKPDIHRPAPAYGWLKSEKFYCHLNLRLETFPTSINMSIFWKFRFLSAWPRPCMHGGPTPNLHQFSPKFDTNLILSRWLRICKNFWWKNEKF
jgi:hypothetical protein